MSKDWVKDINEMHAKFGVHKWVQSELQSDVDFRRLNKFLQFRLDFLTEELNETRKAFNDKDSEEIVDGLIDLCVVAIGTLDVFGVDAWEAWNRVYMANMQKEVGVKPGRPNPFGLPDLLKPAGWEAPNHDDNHGDLNVALSK